MNKIATTVGDLLAKQKLYGTHSTLYLMSDLASLTSSVNYRNSALLFLTVTTTAKKLLALLNLL
jgi:hypothetical protein